MSSPIAAAPGGAQAQALPKSERQRLRAGTGAMFTPDTARLADTASTATRQLRAARPAHRRPHRLAPPVRSPCSPGCSISFLRSPTPEGNTMMVERQVSIDTVDAINFSLVARVEHHDPENAPRVASWASRSTCFTPRSAHSACSPCPSRALQPRKRAMRTWRFDLET